MTVSCDLPFAVEAAFTAPAACATSVDVTYTVTDDCGRANSCTQTIPIVNLPPAITCPATTDAVECAADIQAAVDAQLVSIPYWYRCDS